MRNHKLVPTASSSSKNNTKQEEPVHLSGAYIRSLVKQLSSSSTARSKDHHYSTMGTKPQGLQPQEEEQQAHAAPQTTPVEAQQQQPHKKQVRRRLHTSRPYQERLLNMAEARREIVTALKIHRASMRQAKEQQQQQQQQLLQLQQQQDQVHHHHQVVQEQSQTGSRVSMSPYASCFSDYLYNSSPFSHLTATSSSSTGSYFSPLLPYHTSTPAVAPVQVDALDHLMLPLPTQPLGLNLSFQGFTGSAVNAGGVVDDDGKNDSGTACSFDPITPLLQPSPASSYSVYSSPSATMGAGSNDYMSSSGAATADQNSSSLAAAAAAAAAGEASGQLQLHRALDDEEMAAIYSIGEQHDIEWSDTVNLVTSAWWSKLQDSVVQGGGIQGTAVAPQQAAAVETMEDASSKQYRLQGDCFGDILGHHHQGTMGGSGSDVVLAGMHHLGDYYGTEDVSWPRMDVGEIEGWDAEWLS